MRASGKRILAGAVALWWLVASAHAEVVSASPSGFNLKHVAEIGLPPAAVWTGLADIGKWWDPEHTYSGDARNLSLDPVLRGCLCEKLDLYSGIEHMRVIYARSPRTLRLSGALGPLQEFGVSGSLTWNIEPLGKGSRIVLTYSVGGFADRPLADWAPIVDEVLGAQFRRLVRFLSTGDANEPKPKT